jgi:hypothetical protein
MSYEDTPEPDLELRGKLVRSLGLFREMLPGVARLQPGRRRVQVFRKRRETPHRLRISIPRHRDIDLRRSDIDTRSIQVQARQQGRSCLRVALLVALSFSRHGLSQDWICPLRAGPDVQNCVLS